MLKQSVKQGAKLLAVLAVSPLIAVARLEACCSRSESWFSVLSTVLSLLPGKTGKFARVAFYRFTLDRCAFDLSIDFGSTLNHRTIQIGSDVRIGRGCSIGTVTVGDHSIISSRVNILSGGMQHDVFNTEMNITEHEPEFQRINIGSNTWVGEGSIVLADLGTRCVVAAGSVVFRPVEDGKMVMGNPARPIFRKSNDGGSEARGQRLEDRG
jgi:acetyltransferase-like isoleucine patch superfamily enzyme